MEQYYDTIKKESAFKPISLDELIYQTADAVSCKEFSRQGNFLLGSTVEKQHEENELAAAVRGAVMKLNGKMRDIIYLMYFEGMKQKQIAGILGVSESRVSQVHTTALQKLKFILREYD